MNAFFITGTDTHVGKTYIATGMLRAFHQLGFSTLGIKPVASGATMTHGQLINDDALFLQKMASLNYSYSEINPFVFKERIAPHIAAQFANKKLSVAGLTKAMRWIPSSPADVVIIEGAGGWHCPLNSTETMADFVKAQALDTVLVVGMRLGCLNHAILTFESILKNNVSLKGWVANCVDPQMECLKENIETLQEYLSVPCLGVVAHHAPPEKVLDLTALNLKSKKNA